MKGYTMNKKQAQKAFTLAELLITLSVIGLVAILTIPTMIENHQQKAWNTASTVFERKLEEALKSMNTQETLAGHTNTLDFVNELAKNIKINKICNNNELTSCFEDKIRWGADNEEIEISEIKNAKNFGQENWGTENIGIQFANGVTGIIAYNPACTQDPYNNQYTGMNCIAMLYDTDGFKSSNTQLKDLRSINVNSLADKNCAFEIDGICFGAPFYPEPLTKAECEEIADQGYGNKKEACYWENDYWAGAVKTCGGKDKMPTRTDLQKIAQYIYQDWKELFTGNRKDEVAASLGFKFTTGSRFWVWSGLEESQWITYYYAFSDPDASFNGSRRNYSNFQAVCLVD